MHLIIQEPSPQPLIHGKIVFAVHLVSVCPGTERSSDSLLMAENGYLRPLREYHAPERLQ